MKNSVRKVIETLQLTADEATCLREATRAWLEKAYRNDHEMIATLPRKQVEIEARGFLQKEGVNHFSQPNSKRSARGMHDHQLISKIATIMMCQVEYKSRTLRRRKLQNSSQPTMESDAESVVTKSTESSFRGWGDGDPDYEPSTATSQSPWVKLHYTRQNAQPGMPLLPSIEMDNEIEMRSPQSPTPRTMLLCAGRTVENESVAEETEIAIVSGPEPPHPARITGAVNVSEDTTAIAVISTQNIPTADNNSTPLVEGSDVLLLVPSIPVNTTVDTGCVSQTVPVATGYYQRSVTLPTPSTIPDFSDVDFEQFLHPLESRSDTIDITPTAQGLDNCIDQSRHVQTPHCEQTPPASGRSKTCTRIASLDFLNHSDMKPHLSSNMPEIIDLTKHEMIKIYVGSDHFEEIRKDRVAESFQTLIDTLHDKSRECQRMAQRRVGTFSQKEGAEHIAMFMCNLIADMRKDRRIWNPGALRGVGFEQL